MNAIINNQNEVIGCTAATARTINIAGAVARDGAPVNVRTYRVSKSKANRSKISAEMPVAVAREYRSYTFYMLEGAR